MEFMSHAAVRISNLGFTYPRQPVSCFNNLHLTVQQGERFGLFGPNGAGKTTLMNCMTGLLQYQQGSIQLLGHEIAHHKISINKLFGFVPQDFSFYQELSPAENLAFFGAWAGLNKSTIKRKTDELLDILGLADVRDRKVQEFSPGDAQSAIGIGNCFLSIGTAQTNAAYFDSALVYFKMARGLYRNDPRLENTIIQLERRKQ